MESQEGKTLYANPLCVSLPAMSWAKGTCDSSVTVAVLQEDIKE